MAVWSRVGGAWKTADLFYARVGGAWKHTLNVWVRTGGAWKAAFSYSYKYGNWSACSENCGGGTQTRTATCTRSDGRAVSDTFCTKYGLTKGATSRDCNTDACFSSQTYTASATFTAPHAGLAYTAASQMILLILL